VPHSRMPLAFAMLVRLPPVLGLGVAFWGFMRSGKFAYLIFLPYFMIVFLKNVARERQAAALMREPHAGAPGVSRFEARIVPSPSVAGPVLVVLALILLIIQE